MTEPLCLKGKTALVIGGSRGIGNAIVESLREQHCNVIYTSTSRDAKALDDNTTHWHLDLKSADSIQQCAKRVLALPALDIFVHNAGVSNPEPVWALTAESMMDVMQTNVLGPLSLFPSVATKMKQQQSGRIILIASIAGSVVKPNATVYSATKAATASFARTLACDLAPFGILVNALSPGPTHTDMVEHLLSASDIAKIADKIPLGRLAYPREVANVALFLCSEMNTYITGQNLIIDGGFTIT